MGNSSWKPQIFWWVSYYVKTDNLFTRENKAWSGKRSVENNTFRNSNLKGDKEISFYYGMYNKYKKMLRGMLILDMIFPKRIRCHFRCFWRLLVLEHLVYHWMMSFGFWWTRPGWGMLSLQILLFTCTQLFLEFSLVCLLIIDSRGPWELSMSFSPASKLLL